ncbi:MAG: N-acetylmuramoyl-L-alanine amidase [Alphaproteobacteria bacterium]|nr:MAG: N-acetylmuramoyl-L-alanine amidase [Alphaproteobacteria bacterium]
MEVDTPLATRTLPSPNTRERRQGEKLEFVIVHGTWMAGDEGALHRLTDTAAEVSCHYYITRGGEVIQLVREHEVAFHAGRSRAVNAAGVEVDGLNGWSLGIELANSGPFGGRTPTPEEEADPNWEACEPYSLAQYDALIDLLRDILARHSSITKERVLGHDAVAPGRKSDPGPHFDWSFLEAAGVAVAPE